MSYLVRPKRGFLLGKFMPPHTGHVYLCDFARAYCQKLTILVCALKGDPIPGPLRLAWMREMYPDADVRYVDAPLPQAPEDDPENFWPLWRAASLTALDSVAPDVVFASEDYGHRLASELGARFVPVDIKREVQSVSGTDIRANPLRHWQFLPPAVRPHFVKRVTLFGPESTGKTTLARALAMHYGTVIAPEYGRTYTESFGMDATSAEDIRRIVVGHLAGVSAARRLANRVLIEDTDPVLTAVWSDVLLHARDPWFATFDDLADLYLLCGIDVPWEDDGIRYFPEDADRQRFYTACQSELQARGARYVAISGDGESRLARSIAAIDGMLALR